MRLLGFSILAFAVTVDLALGQTITTSAAPEPTNAPSATPSETPMKYRPVLMSIGPSGLINKIDRLGLTERNPREQGVMFCAIVNKNGKVVSSATYRATTDSEALEHEVRKNLDSSTFVPAIHNSKTVDAIFYGTATFSTVEGRPRLRIFASNESSEVMAENDFIGPQPVYGGDSKFLGLHYPKKADGKTNGIVELNLQVDEDGNLKDISVAYEYPADQGFGEAALADFKDAKFVPAFRNGEPVASSIRLPIYYQAHTR
jgi:TonB family protein